MTVVSFVGTVTDTGSSANYTFPGAAIGSPTSDRIVVVVANAESSTSSSAREPQSCTIGGTAATRAVFVNNPTPTAIFYLVVPSGTTADIVVNYSDTMARAMIGVWTVTGAVETPVDTATDLADSGSSLSTTVDIPAEGGAISGSSHGTQNTDNTWSGATERYDNALSGSSQFSGADTQPTGSGRVGHTVSTTFSSSSQPISQVTAVWETSAASNEVTAAIPLTIATDAAASADHAVVADIPLSTTATAAASADHAVVADIPLSTTVAAETVANHRVAGAVQVGLETAAVTAAPTTTADVDIAIQIGPTRLRELVTIDTVTRNRAQVAIATTRGRTQATVAGETRLRDPVTVGTATKRPAQVAVDTTTRTGKDIDDTRHRGG